MKMKYKLGDKVIIREDVDTDTYYKMEGIG